MTQPPGLSVELDSFLRNEIAYARKRPIALTDRIEDDLKYAGDDASKMMEKFFKRFSIAPGDYEFHRHYEMEGFSPLGVSSRRMKHKDVEYYPREQRIPVTVGMLQRAIDEGVWNTDKLCDDESKLTPPPSSH